jgi:hypothetical protein
MLGEWIDRSDDVACEVEGGVTGTSFADSKPSAMRAADAAQRSRLFGTHGLVTLLASW